MRCAQAIPEEDVESIARDVFALADKIRRLIAQEERVQVVAAALAESVAVLIASIHPESRYEAHVDMLRLIDELIPLSVETMIRAKVAPPDWLNGTRE